MDRYDLIIIGGGPGGLSSAIYAIRAQLKVLLVEQAGLGGQIAVSHIIENYPGFPSPSGPELMQAFEEHAKGIGLEVKYASVAGISKADNIFTLDLGKETLEANALIIATGAQPAPLGVPGEKEFFGRGVSTCGTCDGPFYRNKEIALVGGGDTAVKEAIYLSKIASKVHMVHRRDTFRAEKILQTRLFQQENIEFHYFHNLKEIKGDKMGVTSVEIESINDGKLIELEVMGIFMFVGIRPNTGFIDCEKDEGGFIKTNEKMETSLSGIYAIGDCRVTPLRQVATAVGDGAIAAVQAEEYISALEGQLYEGKKG